MKTLHWKLSILSLSYVYSSPRSSCRSLELLFVFSCLRRQGTSKGSRPVRLGNSIKSCCNPNSVPNLDTLISALLLRKWMNPFLPNFMFCVIIVKTLFAELIS